MTFLSFTNFEVRETLILLKPCCSVFIKDVYISLISYYQRLVPSCIDCGLQYNKPNKSATHLLFKAFHLFVFLPVSVSGV